MTALTRRDIAALVLGAASQPPPRARWAQTAADWRLGFKTPPEDARRRTEAARRPLAARASRQLLRVGPAQFERAGERLGHWFDGDGMVQRFAIADGRVRHRGPLRRDRQSAAAKQAAGRFLYSGYGFAPESRRRLQPRRRHQRRQHQRAAHRRRSLGAVGRRLALARRCAKPRHARPQSFRGAARRRAVLRPPQARPRTAMSGISACSVERCVIWHLAPDGAVRKAKLIELARCQLDARLRRNGAIHRPSCCRPCTATPAASRNRWSTAIAGTPTDPLHALVLDKDTLTIERRHELPARFLLSHRQRLGGRGRHHPPRRLPQR